MHTSEALLTLDAVTVRYKAVEAVTDVSLTVEPGEIVAVLGANGAGKSTLLRSISGLIRPAGGTIHLDGRRIDRMRSHRIAHLGIAHVPEGRRVIAPLTVQQNLELAARASTRCSARDVQAQLDEVFTTFPRLLERCDQPSGLMSGGEQQMLAIGRAIMARPDVLLLDEPSMGLAPIVIGEIYELLRERRGTLSSSGILLAEQSAALAVSVADRCHVLSRGRTRFEGRADALDEDLMVSAYLA